jgi:hypothetical protein
LSCRLPHPRLSKAASRIGSTPRNHDPGSISSLDRAAPDAPILVIIRKAPYRTCALLLQGKGSRGRKLLSSQSPFSSFFFSHPPAAELQPILRLVRLPRTVLAALCPADSNWNCTSSDTTISSSGAPPSSRLPSHHHSRTSTQPQFLFSISVNQGPKRLLADMVLVWG